MLAKEATTHEGLFSTSVVGGALDIVMQQCSFLRPDSWSVPISKCMFTCVRTEIGGRCTDDSNDRTTSGSKGLLRRNEDRKGI